MPRLGISKREGHAKCGILAPNPYFEDLDAWDARVAALANRSVAQCGNQPLSEVHLEYFQSALARSKRGLFGSFLDR